MTGSDRLRDTSAAPADGLDRRGLRRVLTVLCLTETTSWGVVFYAYPVLAPQITADTGWSRTSTAAAFSVALVVAGLVGIPVGRRLDRTGPRPLMTIGSVLAVLAVLAIARAPTLPWFFAAWVLAGVAMAGVLYAPAFAAVTRWWGPRRVRALTTLTLMAGLASTIFAPLTAAIGQRLGWRGAYLVLVVILAVVTVPGHLLGLGGIWPAAPAQHAREAGRHPTAVIRSRPFVLLMVLMGVASLSEAAVVVHQVTLLTDRGLTPTVAAWALGLGGLGQVLGRLGYRALAAATTVRARTVAVLTGATVATSLLAVLPGPATLLIAVAMLAGTARGIFTLLQATAVTDRWGSTHYGRLNGLLTAPTMLATAAAPWAGAAAAESLGGYPAMFGVLAATLAVATVLSLGTVPDPRTDRPT